MANERGHFARVCLQVDIKKPLVPIIRIRKSCLQYVQYEGIEFCLNCGLIGYPSSSCPTTEPTELQASSDNPITSTNLIPQKPSSQAQDHLITYGSWNVVPSRRHFRRCPSPTGKNRPSEGKQHERRSIIDYNASLDTNGTLGSHH